MLKERGKLPVNVKFLVEGEEESGGHAIDEFVKADKGKKLACDAVVVSDSSMYGPGQPALTYGLKGLVYMELKVTGPEPRPALGHLRRRRCRIRSTRWPRSSAGCATRRPAGS